MAKLTAARNTPSKGVVRREVLLVDAATTIYVGGLVAIGDNGYAVPCMPKGTGGAAPYVNLPVVIGVMLNLYGGDFGENAVNVSGTTLSIPNPPNLGSAGALSIVVGIGVFLFDVNGTAFTTTSVGQLAFAVDDHTVDISTNTAVNPCVGRIWGIENSMAWIDTSDHSAMGTTAGA
jgi:hypothetical protein